MAEVDMYKCDPYDCRAPFDARLCRTVCCSAASSRGLQVSSTGSTVSDIGNLPVSGHSGVWIIGQVQAMKANDQCLTVGATYFLSCMQAAKESAGRHMCTGLGKDISVANGPQACAIRAKIQIKTGLCVPLLHKGVASALRMAQGRSPCCKQNLMLLPGNCLNWTVLYCGLC